MTHLGGWGLRVHRTAWAFLPHGLTGGEWVQRWGEAGVWSGVARRSAESGVSTTPTSELEVMSWLAAEAEIARAAHEAETMRPAKEIGVTSHTPRGDQNPLPG